MTLSKAWYITCDRCLAVSPISCEDIASARNLARSNGFTRTKTPATGLFKDLCKNCKPRPLGDTEGGQG